MKKYVIIGLLFFSFHFSPAQTIPADTLLQEVLEASYWQRDFRIGLNFNQSSFSGNWRGGGISSVALGGIAAGRVNYLKGRVTWDNEMELLYGVVNNQGEQSRKQNDRMFLDSKVGYFLANSWGAFASANFISQFAPGYDYDGPERTMISDFLSPGYLTTGIGLEYKPNQEFNLRIAPFSPRFTFMRNQQLYLNVPDNYGVPIGSTMRTEWLALQVFATWDKELADNLNIRTRYMMYANYETLEWRRVDHRLDLTLTARITDWINVTLTSINLYDFDQDPNIQYSHALAIGILYQIGNN